MTPLHKAARKGHIDLVDLLIRHGADVNIRNIANRTPLDLAVDYRKYAVADLLRRSGAVVAEEMLMAA